MYNAILKILYPNNSLIDAAMKGLKGREHFNYSLVKYDNLVIDDIKESNIIILFYSSEYEIEKLKESISSNTILILILEHSILDDNHALFNFVDDIWFSPISEQEILFRMEKIIDGIKLKKEKLLAQNYLDTLINSIPDMVWFKDNNGVHLKVNDAFCNIIGKPKEDIEGKDHFTIWDIPRPEYEKGGYICMESEEDVRKAGKTILLYEKVKNRKGFRRLNTYKSPLYDEDGKMMGTVGIAHDITDLENIDIELQLIINTMQFAILICNAEGKIINVNNKFVEYFKVEKNIIVQQVYHEWLKSNLSQITSINKNGYFECHNYIQPKLQILECHEEIILDTFQKNMGKLCIFRDITKERELENQLLHTSNTDYLTGLYNRRYLYEYMKQFNKVKQITILYMDLDNFKSINDIYGHQVGDEILVLTSSIIKKNFPNELNARIGGDEFLMVSLEPWSIEDIKKKSSLLIEDLKKSPLGIPLSSSIGITTAYDIVIDFDALIKQSDIALYEAKKRGKSQIYFLPI